MKIISYGTIPTDATYHGWPTCVFAGGRLFAAASGNREGHLCPFGRTKLYISDDLGETWSEGVQLSNGPLDDRDPGICICADGSIIVTYFTSTDALLAPRPDDRPNWETLRKNISADVMIREHNFWMLKSYDNGKSWQKRYPAPVNNPHGPSLMQDGRLIWVGMKKSDSCASQYGGQLTRGGLDCAVSNDNGLSWKIVSEIPAPEGQSITGFYEPHCVEAHDGRIVLHIRNHNTNPVSVWQSCSFDGGLSWSIPVYVCDGFPSFLTRLSDGRLLMCYSWRFGDYGVRARISSDNGCSWGEEIILYDKGICRDIGYPTTAELPDGSLFTLWYENVSHAESDFAIRKACRSVLKYCRWIPPEVNF